MYCKELWKICLTPQEFRVACSEVMQLRYNRAARAVQHSAGIPAAVGGVISSLQAGKLQDESGMQQ